MRPSFYCLKINPTGQVILDANNDDDALKEMAAKWQRREVSALFHYTGPAEARAQRRLWPPPPI